MPIDFKLLHDTPALNVEIAVRKVRCSLSLIDWWSWSTGFVKDYQLLELFNIQNSIAWGDEDDEGTRKYFALHHYVTLLDVVLWDITLNWGNPSSTNINFIETITEIPPTPTANRDAGEFWDDVDNHLAGNPIISDPLTNSEMI